MSQRSGFSEEAWERSLESLPGGPDAPEIPDGPDDVVFCDRGDRWHDAKTGRIITDERAKELRAACLPDEPDPDRYHDRRYEDE